MSQKITRSEYNQLLQKETDKKKSEWAEEIKDIAPLIRTKDPNDMIDASALGLSYRVKLLEDIRFFLNELVQEQTQMKKLKLEKFCLVSMVFYALHCFVEVIFVKFAGR